MKGKAALLWPLATLLLAQSSPQPKGRPGSVAKEGHIMAQFFQVRVDRIQRLLGVPEDRARAMAEHWARWDRENMERAARLAQLRQTLNQALAGPGTEEEKNQKVKPLMDSFLQLRRQHEDSRSRFQDEILAGLTPVQQARMLHLMEEVQARLRESLRESRTRGGRY